MSFDSVKQDLARSFLLKIGIPTTQAMLPLNVADTSQPNVSIIVPSQIGLPRSTAQWTGQIPSEKPKFTQEQLADLQAKCAQYINTKIEDVESKRVALPPHECAEVLVWMRDSRVEKLYVSEKPKK